MSVVKIILSLLKFVITKYIPYLFKLAYVFWWNNIKTDSVSRDGWHTIKWPKQYPEQPKY